MALYEKAWWKRWFEKKERKPKVEVLKDIQAILEDLQELSVEVRPLIKELQKLEELEKEREVAGEGILHVNLEAQAKVLDKVLERYEFFQNDIDIDGIRIKQIAKEFLRKAQEAGLTDLVQTKKKEMRWQFDW